MPTEKQFRPGHTNGMQENLGSALQYPKVPYALVGDLAIYTQPLETRGVPWQRYWAKAGLPLGLLEHPASPLPLNLGYRFLEVACSSEGIPHLGMLAGDEMSLDDFGAFGAALQDSLTVHEYLRKGARLIGGRTPGERFWLSSHGDELRFHHFIPGNSGVGKHQVDLFTLIMTINRLRDIAGPGWVPRTLGLGNQVCEALPASQALEGTEVIRTGAGSSYFSLPRSLLARPFNRKTRTPDAVGPGGERPVPGLEDGPVATLRPFIESSLLHQYPDIELAAECAGMSVRSLQRGLAARGLTYRALVNDIRMRLAAKWLEQTSTPVTEIAYALSYSDPANFVRAFRKRCGVTPQAYRAQFIEG